MKHKVKVQFIQCLCMLLVMMSGGMLINAEQLPSDYEKWGKIAVDVAKLNYPDSNISDYQYQGRKVISETEARDTFDLKVQEKNRSFTARVIVSFNPKTESLISVNIVAVKPKGA
nr:DUF3889 domain-containing protein [Fredinandcohnia sp. SECRCQ15]